MKFILSIIFFTALFIAPLTNDENKSFNRERTFDIQHYIIRLHFDKKSKTVFSDSTIHLKPLNDNFKILELDAKDIKFDSIITESSKKDLNFISSKNKVIINLDKTYKKDDLVSVRFKYSVKKPKKGIYFVDAEKIRGKIVRNSQVWTQGESEETHYWLPSFDFPDDKATTEQFLTVRNGETAISNGRLLNEIDNNNGTKTYHYKMDIPHSLYLTSFVIGTYAKITEKYRDIPLSYYVYPNQKEIVPKAFGKTKDMFRIFEELTGINYPYNKYDQTMVADFNFGGMENITATTMSDSELMFANFTSGQAVVEDLVSHELAHSWFGNLVTCRNWAELWLNESFATYMEAAYRERMYGQKDYRRKIEEDANAYFAYSSLNRNNQHSLFNRSADAKNDDTMFTTITYQKGSVVLHTLRKEIGDKAFWDGVNLYLERYKFANAETKDLQAVFEETYKKDLDWFFDQWVYGNNYPVLKIKQFYNQATKQLELQISQNQKGNKYTPNSFTIPLEVEISMSSGKRETKILIDKQKQTIKIAVAEKPFNLVFDKNYKIPLKDISLSKLTIIK